MPSHQILLGTSLLLCQANELIGKSTQFGASKWTKMALSLVEVSKSVLNLNFAHRSHMRARKISVCCLLAERTKPQ